MPKKFTNAKSSQKLKVGIRLKDKTFSVPVTVTKVKSSVRVQ